MFRKLGRAMRELPLLLCFSPSFLAAPISQLCLYFSDPRHPEILVIELIEQEYVLGSLTFYQVRRAYQVLQLANYMLRPSLDAVQTLLILGNTLQNIGQSDGAWVLLGTTVRLAQALGLHTEHGAGHLESDIKNRRALWYVHWVILKAKDATATRKKFHSANSRPQGCHCMAGLFPQCMPRPANQCFQHSSARITPQQHS